MRVLEPSLIDAYISRSNLNGILAAAMLEHGVSQQTLPNEKRFQRLVTFLKDYGTAKMDGDRITGYLKRLDDAMKNFNVSLSDLLLVTSDYSLIDVDRSTYRSQGGLCISRCTADRSETIDEESRFVWVPRRPLIELSRVAMWANLHVESVSVHVPGLKPRPALVDNFVGREDVLEAMHQTHLTQRSKNSKRSAITVLSGLGGAGKTQTALKFALEFEEK